MNEKLDFVNVEAEIVKDTILNFIVPLIAVGICILIGVIFIMPAYKSLPELRNQIGEKTVLRDDLRAKKTNLNKLVDFKSIVDENSDLVNKVLVSEPLVPELLNQIDQIVKGSGMEVSKLSYAYGAEGETATYQSVDVALSSDGSYEQLVVFLRNIEDAARLINIATFRFNIDTAEGFEKVAANFTLVSPYLFVESQAVTDDPVTLDISSQKFIDFINKVKTMRFYDYSAGAFEFPAEEAEEGIEVDEGAEGEAIEGAGETIPGGTQPGATGVQGEEDEVYVPPVVPEGAIPNTQ